MSDLCQCEQHKEAHGDSPRLGCPRLGFERSSVPLAPLRRRGPRAAFEDGVEVLGRGEAAGAGDGVCGLVGRLQKEAGFFDAAAGDPVRRGQARVFLEDVEEARARVARVGDEAVDVDGLGVVRLEAGEGLVHEADLRGGGSAT